MARKPKPVFDATQLLDEFRVYDQAVDVVSSYHWFFTEVTDIADTVTHFERYPRVAASGKTVTPDFTVVFTDGAGLAGEVARLSRRDESVDSVCGQLQGYSELTQMPGPPGHRGGQRAVPVDPVDTVFLTPARVVKDAARRILDERMDDPDHPFTPKRTPVIVQFSQDQDAYVFLLWPVKNGTIHRGNRSVAYGDKDPFVCRPDQFGENKVRYGFMADTVTPLYMATRLWTQVLPTAFWGNEVTVPLDELVTAVRHQFEGYGQTREIRRGMEVLVAAGLAKESDDGKAWVVNRQSLRRTDRDVATAIAEKLRKGPTQTASPARRQRRAEPGDGQGTLF